MTKDNTVLNKLDLFLKKRKFTEVDFIKFEISPFQSEKAAYMENCINKCVLWLIDDVKNKAVDLAIQKKDRNLERYKSQLEEAKVEKK